MTILHSVFSRGFEHLVFFMIENILRRKLSYNSMHIIFFGIVLAELSGGDLDGIKGEMFHARSGVQHLENSLREPTPFH